MTEAASQDIKIWTIGHSTHAMAELTGLLKAQRIERLMDIRTVPRSRHAPQFNQGELSGSLAAAGIEYFHFQELGGWRRPVPDSVNKGWRSDGFRGYADYMQTEEFDAALKRLIAWAAKARLVLMCAEGLFWRCHRQLLSDALLVQGVEVLHIFPDGQIKPHTLTSFAVVSGGQVTYPPEQTDLGF